MKLKNTKKCDDDIKNGIDQIEEKIDRIFKKLFKEH